METYNKFDCFAGRIIRGNHKFAEHVFRVALTNTAPTRTQTVFDPITNHPPPATADGYPAGGLAVTITIDELDGLATVFGAKSVFTASGSGIGPFRYAVFYNDGSTTPADSLISWWDYGESITLKSTETFTVKFNDLDVGQILAIG